VALFDAGSTAFQGTTVTNSVTQVFSTSGLTSPQGVIVQNQGTATIYVGGASLTGSGGGTALTLSPGQEMYISGTAQNVYAITAAGNANTIAGLATTVGLI
jgi:hypothetical protein